MWYRSSLEVLWQDIRHAFRTLRNDPSIGGTDGLTPIEMRLRGRREGAFLSTKLPEVWSPHLPVMRSACIGTDLRGRGDTESSGYGKRTLKTRCAR
jgi:hypothetical protein